MTPVLPDAILRCPGSLACLLDRDNDVVNLQADQGFIGQPSYLLKVLCFCSANPLLHCITRRVTPVHPDAVFLLPESLACLLDRDNNVVDL